MTPFDADPYALMAAAVAHLAPGADDGPEEIELELWEDRDDGTERRCTVTFRTLAAVAVREHGAETAPLPEAAAPSPTWVDDVQSFADGQRWQPPADGQDGPT